MSMTNLLVMALAFRSAISSDLSQSPATEAEETSKGMRDRVSEQREAPLTSKVIVPAGPVSVVTRIRRGRTLSSVRTP